MPNPVSILAFSGSARRESLNRKFLAVAVDEVKHAGGEVTVVDLTDYEMPVYHGDLEDVAGMPHHARKLAELIKSHQGLLIASPEYNSMVTPLLKNVIDWASRADPSPFPGKVAAVVSASPGPLGGARSLRQAQQLLLHLGCHVVPGNAMLPHASQAFTPEGRLKDERSLATVKKLAAALVETTRNLA